MKHSEVDPVRHENILSRIQLICTGRVSRCPRRRGYERETRMCPDECSKSMGLCRATPIVSGEERTNVNDKHNRVVRRFIRGSLKHWTQYDDSDGRGRRMWQSSVGYTTRVEWVTRSHGCRGNVTYARPRVLYAEDGNPCEKGWMRR